jgi:hypothetical protein
VFIAGELEFVNIGDDDLRISARQRDGPDDTNRIV